MTANQDLWEALAGELEASDPAITRSTMMGLPCLRVDGAFFASFDERKGALIIKLPAKEVQARVAEGRGHSFAPAGKVFREWIAIDNEDEAIWRASLTEALAFVRRA